MVFVFPLPKVVLFPSTTQPLNIFEPRYVEMINDAVEQEIEVALACTEEPGEEASGKGVLGHIRNVAGCGPVQLLERRPDGTMLVLLKSVRKVRLESAVASPKPYILANEVTLTERSDLESGNVFYLHRILRELTGWLERNVPHPKRREEFIDNLKDDQEKVNTACSLLIEDSNWQQKLLEIDNINERLKALTALLETGAASH